MFFKQVHHKTNSRGNSTHLHIFILYVHGTRVENLALHQRKIFRLKINLLYGNSTNLSHLVICRQLAERHLMSCKVGGRDRGPA